jgi:chromosome segregation protein
VIRSFLGICQFVVITHNKKTMHLADQLIGVTQQERGVSTRVAVRLDQVGSGGEIRAGGTGKDGSMTDAHKTPVTADAQAVA